MYCQFGEALYHSIVNPEKAEAEFLESLRSANSSGSSQPKSAHM